MVWQLLQTWVDEQQAATDRKCHILLRVWKENKKMQAHTQMTHSNFSFYIFLFIFVNILQKAKETLILIVLTNK